MKKAKLVSKKLISTKKLQNKSQHFDKKMLIYAEMTMLKFPNEKITVCQNFKILEELNDESPC